MYLITRLHAFFIIFLTYFCTAGVIIILTLITLLGPIIFKLLKLFYMYIFSIYYLTFQILLGAMNHLFKLGREYNYCYLFQYLHISICTPVE